MVHVGVHRSSKSVILEQLSHNDGYANTDVDNLLPESNECLPGGPSCIESGLNMNLVSEQMLRENPHHIACVSRNAGR